MPPSHPTFDANDEALNETLDKMKIRQRLNVKEGKMLGRPKTAAISGWWLSGKRGKMDIMNKEHESTYALLVRSEDRNRGRMEVGIFTLFVLSAVLAVWQFARQPSALPLDRVTTSVPEEHVAS
jgi:hypothetical protein